MILQKTAMKKVVDKWITKYAWSHLKDYTYFAIMILLTIIVGVSLLNSSAAIVACLN